MRACLAVGLFVVALSLRRASSVGPALAADECNGLRVCLPVAGPWVVVPPGGVDYELPAHSRGTSSRALMLASATRDIDVSFRAEPGSPVGPGVTTRRSVVFRAVAHACQRRGVELPALHRLHPDPRWRWAGPDGCHCDRAGAEADAASAEHRGHEGRAAALADRAARVSGGVATRRLDARRRFSAGAASVRCDARRRSCSPVDRGRRARRPRHSVERLPAPEPRSRSAPSARGHHELRLARSCSPRWSCPLAALAVYLWLERKPSRQAISSRTWRSSPRSAAGRAGSAILSRP